jgi:3-oxoadipate enol-lactonase
MKIKTDQGMVEVREFGGNGGDVVVLLHPLATSGRIWQRFGEWLGRDGRTVLAPDLPAVGISSLDGLSIVDLAAQVATVLDQRQARSVDVLGMSMGGCVAQQLVLDRPELVGRLVLADTTSCYGPDRVASWEERARTAETSIRTGLLDFQLKRWFTESFRAAEPAECNRIAGIFVDTPAAVHAACARALGGFDVTERLGEIKAPTLVIVGEQDYATPAAMSEVVASSIDGARLEVVPDAGHFSIVQSRPAWTLIADHFAPGASN